MFLVSSVVFHATGYFFWIDSGFLEKKEKGNKSGHSCADQLVI
jgi:hypothetical protein